MDGNSLICCLCREVQLIQRTCMNETLYIWTLNFHKVVRQQNSGVVEDFILPYSALYLWIQKWKNYWNRSTFAKVIVKIKVARFFMAHGVVWRPAETNPREYLHTPYIFGNYSHWATFLPLLVWSIFIRLAVVASQTCEVAQIPRKFELTAVQCHSRSMILYQSKGRTRLPISH